MRTRPDYYYTASARALLAASPSRGRNGTRRSGSFLSVTRYSAASGAAAGAGLVTFFATAGAFLTAAFRAAAFFRGVLLGVAFFATGLSAASFAAWNSAHLFLVASEIALLPAALILLLRPDAGFGVSDAAAGPL